LNPWLQVLPEFNLLLLLRDWDFFSYSQIYQLRLFQTIYQLYYVDCVLQSGNELKLTQYFAFSPFTCRPTSMLSTNTCLFNIFAVTLPGRMQLLQALHALVYFSPCITCKMECFAYKTAFFVSQRLSAKDTRSMRN
jgi:hypothetical protein